MSKRRLAGRVTHTDGVNGYPSGLPFLDVGDHAIGQLGVGGAVEVVVVQIQDGLRVGGPSGLVRDAHEVLAQDLREDGLPERAVFAEDLVADVLGKTESRQSTGWVGRRGA